MTTLINRRGFLWGLSGVVAFGISSNARAQSIRGGEIRFPAFASVEEQASQSDLWVMDLYFKPMRMIPVELSDPKTGKKKLEFVWYIVYRGFNHKLESKTKENPAVNELDKPVAPQQFIPEALLVVTDNDRNEVFSDQVIPEALAAINKREKGRYKSSVAIVGPIPDQSEPGSPEEKAVEGVFMWRGVNPDANRYTVYLTGFSNSIRKVNGPDEKPIIQSKTVMQKYWRRGDRFDQNEAEIVLEGDPQWIYR
ncbi:hypothetical protein [Schlesneria paludicola]|uniref:hypothetical protein n=1 Tax=Schlesneria paludicola TaxID=360056 RepID=UPI000308F34C|nr:hypothetical protein [Schlesneria paludicola]